MRSGAQLSRAGSAALPVIVKGGRASAPPNRGWLGGGGHRVRIRPGQGRIEHGVLGLFGCDQSEVDGVDGVTLGPLGVALSARDCLDLGDRGLAPFEQKRASQRSATRSNRSGSACRIATQTASASIRSTPRQLTDRVSDQGEVAVF
jgi:hypothetical protein